MSRHCGPGFGISTRDTLHPSWQTSSGDVVVPGCSKNTRARAGVQLFPVQSRPRTVDGVGADRPTVTAAAVTWGRRRQRLAGESRDPVRAGRLFRSLTRNVAIPVSTSRLASAPSHSLHVRLSRSLPPIGRFAPGISWLPLSGFSRGSLCAVGQGIYCGGPFVAPGWGYERHRPASAARRR